MTDSLFLHLLYRRKPVLAVSAVAGHADLEEITQTFPVPHLPGPVPVDHGAGYCLFKKSSGKI